MSDTKPKLGCRYCQGEPEPGYIEMPNNGPVVPCPICNRKDDYDFAEAQRQEQAERGLAQLRRRGII